MNTIKNSARRTAASWIAVAILGACGGGGGTGVSAPATGSGTGPATAGVGTGGTGAGAYVLGAITGFGSIIVNGVRYDDSMARVLDDDGLPRRSDELRLGMTVEIRGGSPTVDAQGVARASATEVRFNRSLTGPVASVNLAAGSLVVFDQTVLVTNTTVYEDVAGLSAITAGQVIEVYAQRDAQGRLVATRIERKDGASAVGASSVALRLGGAISALSADRLQFKLGSVTVMLSSPLSDTLGNGSEVAVVARATATANVVSALSVQSRSSTRNLDSSVNSAEVEGFITTFNSPASFSVNGVAVVTQANTRFEGPSAGLVLGARVEVEGSVASGVITATKVEIKTSQSDDRGSSAPSSSAFEVHGTISNLDANAMRFALRGLTVTWDATTEFKEGSAAQLTNGRKVEVKAVRGADPTTLKAVRISFED